jgi:hypothetical protein
MNTDKIELNSSGWPFNKPVPQSFLGRHGLGGGDCDGRSVKICAYLWLNPKSIQSGFLPHLEGKITADSRLLPHIPAYSRVSGEVGLSCGLSGDQNKPQIYTGEHR